MRWKDLDSPEACIAAATRLHDGIYSPCSPTPAQKRVGCTSPEAVCVTLAIAERCPEGWYCTKPSYVPPLQGATDCDRRVYDWKPGGTSQRGYKDAKMPSMRDGTTAAILSWVERTLKAICGTSGDAGIRIYAGSLLDDLDVPVSFDVMLRTGQEMYDRLVVDKPWSKA